MALCEYQGCDREATADEHYTTGLCAEHSKEFADCVKRGARPMLLFWLNMHGGAGEAAEEVVKRC
jgi:hypothetical protein